MINIKDLSFIDSDRDLTVARFTWPSSATIANFCQAQNLDEAALLRYLHSVSARALTDSVVHINMQTFELKEPVKRREVTITITFDPETTVVQILSKADLNSGS